MTLKLNGTNSEAAPAYAGDDADTGLQCGTNELKLVTGGSARATVDSSGRLLVGTASTYDGEASNLIVAGSGHTGITVASTGSNQRTNLYFADGTSGTAAYAGGLSYDHNNNTLLVRTASSEIARFTTTGLTFNGDTASANALGDYEEGTWTPSYNSGITGDGYNVQEGTYTKIGRLVTFALHLRANSGTNAGSEQVKITGLPFNNGGSTNEGGAFFNYRSDLHSGAGPFLHIGQNTNIIHWFSTGGGNWVGTDGGGLLNKAFHINGFYFV